MRSNLIGIILLVAIALFVSTDQSLSQDCDSGTFDGAFNGELVVPQNLNCNEREEYWFTDQGSQIIPYLWFLNLEQVNSTTKFSAPSNMDKLRYLPQRPTRLNPDGIPIGFTLGNAKNNEIYRQISDGWLGITCSACHTGQVEFNGAKYLIDGAPAMGDFQTLFRELVRAMQATLDDQEKFDRFADAVIADSDERGIGGTTQKEQLRTQLRRITDIRKEWNDRNQGSARSGDYGNGRLDALGAIFNETAATALEVAGNRKEADAPVSYPFVWDTPQHDKVQWNGSIPNAKLGSLSRNVGEVIGVFGALELRERRIFPPRFGHKTSVNVGALAKLEGFLWKMQSPQWSDTSLPPINKDLVKEEGEGHRLFKDYCYSCHQTIDRTDVDRKIKAVMVPVINPDNSNDPNTVRTDITMALNFLKRGAQARKTRRSSA